MGTVVNFAENLETVPEDNPGGISPHVFFRSTPVSWEKFYSNIILRMQDSTWLEKKGV